MLKWNRSILALVCAMLAGAAHAAALKGNSADYGASVPAGAAGRVVLVQPGTRAINVTDGETVTINANGNSFTWHVSTYPNVNSFELSKIAPPGVATPGVRVYVAHDPLYTGR
ncbi:MAG: CzcE family metal-binding protein [Pseudomonadota bacterium]